MFGKVTHAVVIDMLIVGCCWRCCRCEDVSKKTRSLFIASCWKHHCLSCFREIFRSFLIFQDIGSSSLIYYRLYMDDGYTEISKNTASGTTTTEFFEFLTPGNPYRFAVAAVNAAGEGPRSERITLTASDVAGQAYDVEATFQSSYRIDIAWKKPLLTGASGMSGYKVWVDDGNGGNIDKLIWDGGTKASTLYYSWQPVFSDGSVALLAGHTYRFQVQSVNPTGDGAKSNIFSIVAAAKPDAPGRPLVNRRIQCLIRSVTFWVGLLGEGCFFWENNR